MDKSPGAPGNDSGQYAEPIGGSASCMLHYVETAMDIVGAHRAIALRTLGAPGAIWEIWAIGQTAEHHWIRQRDVDVAPRSPLRRRGILPVHRNQIVKPQSRETLH